MEGGFPHMLFDPKFKLLTLVNPWTIPIPRCVNNLRPGTRRVSVFNLPDVPDSISAVGFGVLIN